MSEDIAVYVGEDGRTASLFDRGKLTVYRREQSYWTIFKEKEFSSSPVSGLPELRERMMEVRDFLGECKIIVGLSISGVPYFELEKGGFSVWEYEGNPLSFLDYISMEEEKTRRKVFTGERSESRTGPVEITDGCYQISLKEVQEGKAGITTKQALLPFLRKGDFYELEVLCNHIPPWLEAELAAGNFHGEKSKTGINEFKITITKKCCSRL